MKSQHPCCPAASCISGVRAPRLMLEDKDQAPLASVHACSHITAVALCSCRCVGLQLARSKSKCHALLSVLAVWIIWGGHRDFLMSIVIRCCTQRWASPKVPACIWEIWRLLGSLSVCAQVNDPLPRQVRGRCLDCGCLLKRKHHTEYIAMK